MKALLHKGIKEIIDQYPEVEKALDSYGIGCGPCSVGICQLKDIVDIHNLPQDQEQELMQKIAGIVYPDQDVKIPSAGKKTPAAVGDKKFSPPMQRLVDEHILIKRWIALFPWMDRNLSASQVGELSAKFNEVDEKMGFSADKYLGLIEKLEKQFEAQTAKDN